MSDLDALTAAIAGDPAPSARHAARVLRRLPELLRTPESEPDEGEEGEDG